MDIPASYALLCGKEAAMYENLLKTAQRVPLKDQTADWTAALAAQRKTFNTCVLFGALLHGAGPSSPAQMEINQPTLKRPEVEGDKQNLVMLLLTSGVVVASMYESEIKSFGKYIDAAKLHKPDLDVHKEDMWQHWCSVRRYFAKELTGELF